MPLSVAHWSMLNGSGMHRVAEAMANAEKAIGLSSFVVDCTQKCEAWESALSADIHVIHTHLPDPIRDKITKPIVWIGHGTPDHVFQSAVEAGSGAPYAHADPLMLMQYWLKNADARVTFWPRHQWIYESMVTKGARVDCVPLGVDTAFWSHGTTRGKYYGEPSILTAENPHYIKWPYDLFVAWPQVVRSGFHSGKLHALYLPYDMHRWFFPLVNANGCSFSSYLSPQTFGPEDLRNAFKSVDYVIGLVRYGDFNHLSLQANAAGAKTISYAGNPYADFWITEGDQRAIAEQWAAILAGKESPRSKTPVPDIAETAQAMNRIYESLA